MKNAKGQRGFSAEQQVQNLKMFSQPAPMAWLCDDG